MTRILKMTVAAVVLSALAACSGGSPQQQREADRNRDAIVAVCVADGEDPARCACEADALKEAVDEESFVLLADLAEAMTLAGSEEAKGLLALGAMSNPRLVAAIEKAEAAGAKCRR